MSIWQFFKEKWQGENYFAFTVLLAVVVALAIVSVCFIEYMVPTVLVLLLLALLWSNFPRLASAFSWK